MFYVLFCYRSLPFAHDLYISLLPPSLNGGLVAGHDKPDAGTDSDYLVKRGYDRRVNRHTGLVARYGVNKFLVKWPRSFEEDYPDLIKHMTFYGRVLNHEFIVNLDMSLEYDVEVSVFL